MAEFWVSSGHHLARRTEGGGLAVTDELLLAWLARPELVPPAEACPAERRLHALLSAEPRRPVAPGEIAAILDEDARENWDLMIGFRDRLLAARTIEAAYLSIVRSGTGGLPPLFLNQLAHLILRNALDGSDDPFQLRAAELFFRPQLVSFHDGSVLLADAEIIEAYENGRHAAPLTAMLGKDPAAELDVLEEANAWTYWSRSDAFTMVLNLGSNARSREALARVIEAWIRHLLGIAVRVEPQKEIHDRDWRWFVGLDAEATRIGNLLWQDGELDTASSGRLLALFRLEFEDPAVAAPQLGDRPVYLLLAMTSDRIVRMKPQNLVVGLPLAAAVQAA